MPPPRQKRVSRLREVPGPGRRVSRARRLIGGDRRRSHDRCEAGNERDDVDERDCRNRTMALSVRITANATTPPMAAPSPAMPLDC